VLQGNEQDGASLLKENYFDATDTIRHYDTVRGTFSSIFLSALALLASYATAQLKDVNNFQVLRGVGIIGSVLSVLSVLVVMKLGSLIERQRIRARSSIRILEEITQQRAISRVDEETISSIGSSWLSKVSLGVLWTSLFLVFLLINIIISIFPRVILGL
jgi:hypothetical protein